MTNSTADFGLGIVKAKLRAENRSMRQIFRPNTVIKIPFRVLLYSSMLLGFMAKAELGFYRQPTSPLASGQTSISSLEKYQVENFEVLKWFEVEYKISNIKLSAWLESKNAVEAKDLSSLLITNKRIAKSAQASELYLQNDFLEKNTLVKKIKTQKDWCQVYELKNEKKTFWVHKNDLDLHPSDKGQVRLKHKSPLYHPVSKKIIMYLTAGTQIDVWQYDNNWLQVIYNKYSYLLKNEGHISYLSFAQSIKNKASTQWVNVNWQDSKLWDAKKQEVALSSIEQIVVDSSSLIIHKDKSILYSKPEHNSKVEQKISYASKLKKLDIDSVIWASSKIPESGIVWWPKSHSNRKIHNNNYLRTTELFSKRIFDIASSPKTQGLQFASANGVFRSTNGKLWQEIEQFKNSNLPIAFAKNGHLFIGEWRSKNDGKDFESYIHWDKLIAHLKQTGHKALNTLRLTQIEVLDDSGEKIRIAIQSPSKNIHLVSHNAGKDWQKVLERIVNEDLF